MQNLPKDFLNDYVQDAVWSVARDEWDTLQDAGYRVTCDWTSGESLCGRTGALEMERGYHVDIRIESEESGRTEVVGGASFNVVPPKTDFDFHEIINTVVCWDSEKYQAVTGAVPHTVVRGER